jgi:pimeloyl-ACP methyl ester carboxylesterase
MSPRRRAGKKLLKALLPVIFAPVLVGAVFAVWVVRGASHPPRRAYLMTPEDFALVSERGLKVTEETWQNDDGTQARGWLLRGTEGAPALVILHRYGADRSWVLNLGVKVNEATNFTILWPDLRGHGQDPPVQTTSFGPSESKDVLAAEAFLRGLKTPQGRPLVGESVGLYGVELGAYAALLAARDDERVKALVLDSAPASADDALYGVVSERTGMDNGLLRLLARAGARLYFLGGYESAPACTVAEGLKGRRTLLLAGEDSGRLRASTEALAKCFADPASVELRADLPITGFKVESASGQQSETYASLVIDFFKRTLGPAS